MSRISGGKERKGRGVGCLVGMDGRLCGMILNGTARMYF